jgi:drug/metabolite transporter (DMT)-like permease
MMDSPFLGPLAAFGSSVTWALAGTWYTRVSREYSGFSVNFTRALVALPLSLISVLFFSGGFREGYSLFLELQPSQVGWLALSMAAAYGVGDVSFFAASRRLGLPTALAIASCFPVWTLLGAYFFLNQVPTGLQMCGLLISISGVVIVILSRKTQSFSESPIQETAIPSEPHLNVVFGSPWRGVGFAGVASLAWAMNSFASSRGGLGISAHVGNSVRILSALVCSGLLGHFLARQHPRVLPLRVIAPMSWLLVLESYGGAFFYVYGLSNAP